MTNVQWFLGAMSAVDLLRLMSLVTVGVLGVGVVVTRYVLHLIAGKRLLFDSLGCLLLDCVLHHVVERGIGLFGLHVI